MEQGMSFACPVLQRVMTTDYLLSSTMTSSIVVENVPQLGWETKMAMTFPFAHGQKYDAWKQDRLRIKSEAGCNNPSTVFKAHGIFKESFC